MMRQRPDGFEKRRGHTPLFLLFTTAFRCYFTASFLNRGAADAAEAGNGRDSRRSGRASGISNQPPLFLGGDCLSALLICFHGIAYRISCAGSTDLPQLALFYHTHALIQHVESLELLFSESEQALASCTPSHLQATCSRPPTFLYPSHPLSLRKKCPSCASNDGACGVALSPTAATSSSSRSLRRLRSHLQRNRLSESRTVRRRSAWRRCRVCKSTVAWRCC